MHKPRLIKIIFFSIFILLATISRAQQNIKFYLEPSGDFLFGSEQTTTDQFESTFTRISSFSADSAYRISVSDTYERSQTSKVKQSFGGGLRGLMEIPVGNRLSVRAGLGLRYERYAFDERVNSSLTTISSSMDTLGKVANSTSGGGGFTPINCVSVIEGFDDFEAQLNFVPSYSNLLLEVPLALRYEVLPNKVGISLGATVVTPLRSTYEFTDFAFNVQNHPEAPEGVCANVTSLAINTSGDRTADFQMAGEISADILLTDQFRLVASASQMVSDRFIQEEQTIFVNSGFSGSYRPLRLSLGVQWLLGGGSVEVEY